MVVVSRTSHNDPENQTKGVTKMRVTTITRASEKAGREASSAVYEVPFELTLDEAVERAGGVEAIVQLVTGAEQAEAAKTIKRYERAGLAHNVIEAKMATWTPGAKAERIINPVKAMTKRATKMNKEEVEALIAQLQASLV
jgi:hypothetical protein